MANLEELVVKLSAETSSLRAELATAAKVTKDSMDKMQGSLDSLAQNSKKNLGFFETALASAIGFLGSEIVTKALSTLQSGFAAVARELQEGAHASAEQEAAFQKLANAMQLTGNYTRDGQAALQEFADEAERLTGVDDALIASNLALLASMTKLDAEGLKKAEQAALALSQAYNVDLETAVRLVGKGIEGNTEAFKRYGIELAASSDKATNLSNIVKAFPFEAAIAQINTFAGASNVLGVSFDNLTKALASVAVQNPVVVAMMKEMTLIFHELTDETNANAIALKQDFAQALLSIVEVIGVTVLMLDALIKGFQIVGIVLTRALGGLDDWKKGLEEVNEVINNQSMLGRLAENLARVQESGSRAFGAIAENAKVAEPTIHGVTKATRELTEAQKAHNEVNKEFAEGLAKQSNAIDREYKFRSDVLKNAMETEAITKEEYFAAQNEIMLTQFALENQALIDARAMDSITEQQYRDAQTALAQEHATKQMEAQARQTAFEKEQQKIRAQNLKDSFAYIATLSQSSNQTLAAIGKAAAITTATIDGYAAVQKALAAAPPPFGFALAAAVGVAAAANVAKIAGVGLQSGITEIPRSSTGGNLGDNFPAILAPGERVVDAGTNQDLKSFLAGAGEGTGATLTVNVSIAPGTGMTHDQAANLVAQLNDYFVSGGLRLLS